MSGKSALEQFAYSLHFINERLPLFSIGFYPLLELLWKCKNGTNALFKFKKLLWFSCIPPPFKIWKGFMRNGDMFSTLALGRVRDIFWGGVRHGARMESALHWWLRRNVTNQTLRLFLLQRLASSLRFVLIEQFRNYIFWHNEESSALIDGIAKSVISFCNTVSLKKNYKCKGRHKFLQQETGFAACRETLKTVTVSTEFTFNKLKLKTSSRLMTRVNGTKGRLSSNSEKD
jgi:hypothetical protein